MAITLPGTGASVESRTKGSDQRQVVATGGVAVAHGVNPSAAAAGADLDFVSNRHGVPFFIGGHPNIYVSSHTISDADGAQTNLTMCTAASGWKIVLTQISVVCDAANTINTAVRIGFGTATVPTPTINGTAGIVIDGNFGPGSGQQKGTGAGIIAVGADAEDLRITCGDPQGGNLYIQYSYFVIES